MSTPALKKSGHLAVPGNCLHLYTDSVPFCCSPAGVCDADTETLCVSSCLYILWTLLRSELFVSLQMSECVCVNVNKADLIWTVHFQVEVSRAFCPFLIE